MSYTSWTTAAVMAWRPGGGIDVIYGWRSYTPHDEELEALNIVALLREFRCTYLVHDMGNAGATREVLISQVGFPKNRIIPMRYQGELNGPWIRYIAGDENMGRRDFYELDKARTLTLCCAALRHCWIQTFAYDYEGTQNPGLLHDFLALMSESRDSRFHGMSYAIIRDQKFGPDDFAHSVNLGFCALCFENDAWPDLSQLQLPERLSNLKLDDLGLDFPEYFPHED